MLSHPDTNLQASLTEEDRRTFGFDMRGLHWPTYLDIYCQVSKSQKRDNYFFRESGTLSSGTRPSPKLPAGGSSSGSTSSTPSSRCCHQSSSSTTHHHQSSVMISFAFFYHPGIHSSPVRLLPLPALLLVTNFSTIVSWWSWRRFTFLNASVRHIASLANSDNFGSTFSAALN